MLRNMWANWVLSFHKDQLLVASHDLSTHTQRHSSMHTSIQCDCHNTMCTHICNIHMFPTFYLGAYRRCVCVSLHACMFLYFSVATGVYVCVRVMYDFIMENTQNSLGCIKPVPPNTSFPLHLHTIIYTEPHCTCTQTHTHTHRDTQRHTHSLQFNSI